MVQSQFEQHAQNGHWHYCAKQGCKYLTYAPSKSKYSISSPLTTMFFFEIVAGLIALLILLSMANRLLPI